MLFMKMYIGFSVSKQMKVLNGNTYQICYGSRSILSIC